MKEHILVINPNSSQRVTRGIDEALAPLRIPGGPAIECATLHEGPPGIETQMHVESVVGPLCRLVDERAKDCAAFVIACYSDPGVYAAREVVNKPVFGIAECGILTALSLGQRVGVIAILRQSIPRHLRQLGAMGVRDRLAAELPLEMGVADLAQHQSTSDRLLERGRTLRDTHGADVIVMGCAGLARYRDALEQSLDVPVVEPTQAAVAMAIGQVRLGWRRGSSTVST